MKRNEVLNRLGYQVPKHRQVRVIVHSDVKNEADDHYAIVHHLLTPSFDVRGIVAAHFEGRYTQHRQELDAGKPSPQGKLLHKFFQGEGQSMERSFAELKKLMALCDMDDVPCWRGCSAPLHAQNEAPNSEGVQMIIREAMRQDERPLYILLQGCLTDLAAALNRAPEIAERMTAVWIGGSAYPSGGWEFNLMQDIHAARTVFASSIALWQIPSNVYCQVEVSLADLAQKVRPCGAVGAYLFQELVEMNEIMCQFPGTVYRGENWHLGDQPTAGVLLQSGERGHYHIRTAPYIEDDCSYTENPNGPLIRVYDQIDTRMMLEDFYGKLRLCYGS